MDPRQFAVESPFIPGGRALEVALLEDLSSGHQGRKPIDHLMRPDAWPLKIPHALRRLMQQSMDLFDVWKLPDFLKKHLLRGVEAGHQLEFACGIGRNPVRFLSLRCLGAEIDLD